MLGTRLCCSHWSWKLKTFLSWIRVYVLQPQIKLCWVQYCIATIDCEDFTMLTTENSGTAIDHGEIMRFIMSFYQDAQRSWDQDALIEAEIKIPYGAEIIMIVLVHHLKKILCWISVSQLRGARYGQRPGSKTEANALKEGRGDVMELKGSCSIMLIVILYVMINAVGSRVTAVGNTFPTARSI